MSDAKERALKAMRNGIEPMVRESMLFGVPVSDFSEPDELRALAMFALTKMYRAQNQKTPQQELEEFKRRVRHEG